MEFPVSAQEQYDLAIKHECSFCGAKVDERCSGIVFPQYPHTDRLKQGLIDKGWTAEQVDACYEF